jgi:hypothetical protein
MWHLIQTAIRARYGHWSSSMREEMLNGIKALEKEIESRHFAGLKRD